MFPSPHQTETWPCKRDGAIMASNPDRAPRNYQPPSGVERITPTYHQPANSLGLSHLPTKYPQIQDKVPHDERPPPAAERITPTYYQPTNPPGPSHRQTKSHHLPDEALRDERSPPVERITPTYYQPANPPVPSHPSKKCQPTNPPKPPHPPTKSARVPEKAPHERPATVLKWILPAESAPVHAPVYTPNMPVNFIYKMPTMVRSETPSYSFTDDSAISVPDV